MSTAVAGRAVAGGNGRIRARDDYQRPPAFTNYGMSGLVCVVDRRGSTLEFAGGLLTVRSATHPTWRIGVSQMSVLIVHGRVAADTTVWRGLADAGVGVAMTGGRHGDDVAWLAAGLSTNGGLRQRQHLACADPARRSSLARWVVDQKAAAMERELASGWPTDGDRVCRAIARMRSSLGAAFDIASLTGIEGALAADWFAALGARIGRHWGFRGRNRRPPCDPLNALLSYGYAIACADALAAVQPIGFDPAIGFLHEIYPGRYSLALDALECLRPSVDAIAVQLLQSELTRDNFKDRGITRASMQVSNASRAGFMPCDCNWAANLRRESDLATHLPAAPFARRADTVVGF